MATKVLHKNLTGSNKKGWVLSRTGKYWYPIGEPHNKKSTRFCNLPDDEHLALWDESHNEGENDYYWCNKCSAMQAG